MIELTPEEKSSTPKQLLELCYKDSTRWFDVIKYLKNELGLGTLANWLGSEIDKLRKELEVTP